MGVSVPFSPLPPPLPEYGRVEGLDPVSWDPPSRVGAEGRSRSGLGWFPLPLYRSRWSGFSPSGRGGRNSGLAAILVYTEDDILVFGEVCEEVLGQEVFECLSSGVQDIAWIDLKHIQIKVVGTCNVSMICTRQL